MTRARGHLTAIGAPLRLAAHRMSLEDRDTLKYWMQRRAYRILSMHREYLDSSESAHVERLYAESSGSLVHRGILTSEFAPTVYGVALATYLGLVWEKAA